MSKTVEVGWQHPETEEEFRVRCSITDTDEVQVTEVVEDRPGGKERPEIIELVEADFARISERALEERQDLEEMAEERGAEAWL